MFFDAITINKDDAYDYANLPKAARGKFVKAKDSQLEDAFLADAETKKMMDAGFNFLRGELQKLNPELYKPLVHTTYAQDIDIDLGGGWVDYVTYYRADYAAITSWAKTLQADSTNVVPRVNVGLEQGNAKVFTFELGYDLRFVQLKKLDELKMGKDIKSIYQDIMLTSWELFCQETVYLGINGSTGLFNNTTVVPVHNTGISKADVINGTVTDEQLNSIVNGIIAQAMDASNRNPAVIPNRLLVPTWFTQALADRMSALYTNNLLSYLKEHNLAVGEGFDKVEIVGRPALNNLGVAGVGRIVAYRKDKRYARVDIPVPFQHLITLPNMERHAYTTVYAGQISEVQFPYNTAGDTFAPIQYFDFVA